MPVVDGKKVELIMNPYMKSNEAFIRKFYRLLEVNEHNQQHNKCLTTKYKTSLLKII